MYFFEKELGFERFDESVCFKCILQQICYPKSFLNVSIFFRKTHLVSFKTTDFERFQIFYVSVAFYSNFATFCKFLNFKVFFFLKKPVSFSKNSISDCFEKSYYFSRILEHIYQF